MPDRPYRTVRIPPVHELERGDLTHLDALLAVTDVLVTQPVRADYRDLPLGTIFADFDRWYSGTALAGPPVDDPAFAPGPSGD